MEQEIRKFTDLKERLTAQRTWIASKRFFFLVPNFTGITSNVANIENYGMGTQFIYAGQCSCAQECCNDGISGSTTQIISVATNFCGFKSDRDGILYLLFGHRFGRF
jgi:hypothetical protein